MNIEEKVEKIQEGTLEIIDIDELKEKLGKENRGIEIIKIEDSYQLCTKTKYYEYIYPIFDKRAKPTLSPAALEVISIIAYNPKITRAEIESI